MKLDGEGLMVGGIVRRMSRREEEKITRFMLQLPSQAERQPRSVLKFSLKTPNQI